MPRRAPIDAPVVADEANRVLVDRALSALRCRGLAPTESLDSSSSSPSTKDRVRVVGDMMPRLEAAAAAAPPVNDGALDRVLLLLRVMYGDRVKVDVLNE